MTLPARLGTDPTHVLQVYQAADFTAVDGANLGDRITVATELNLGDTYQLHPGARLTKLMLRQDDDADTLTIETKTEAGRVDAAVHLDCCVTLMSPDGATLEALILVEMNLDDATIAGLHIFPLAPMAPRTPYSLVAMDREAAHARFAETACVSFTRGTHITMATGAQIPIERLRVGDAVLTRDHGAQKIRWIGQQTVRAQGAFAPIRILKGTLNNANDLIVGPNHRLFVYQRRDHVKAGRAEVLVKAQMLLNGKTVQRTDGGFVDYFQLLFDRHEIIFAEGIAAETLLVDTRTRPAIPPEMHAQMDPASHQRADAFELREAMTETTNTVDLLRLASR